VDVTTSRRKLRFTVLKFATHTALRNPLYENKLTKIYFFLGMSEMVKERPPNPIEFLASYLLKHDPQRITDSSTVPLVGSATQPLQHQGSR
jgi:hypothetical protein